MKLATSRVRPANVIKRAIRGNLRRQEILGGVLGQGFHIARINIELLNRKGAQPGEIAMAIAAYAGGLKNQAALMVRRPARRSVKRIALGDLAEAGFLVQPHGYIRRAELMPDAAGHSSV